MNLKLNGELVVSLPEINQASRSIDTLSPAVTAPIAVVSKPNLVKYSLQLTFQTHIRSSSYIADNVNDIPLPMSWIYLPAILHESASEPFISAFCRTKRSSCPVFMFLISNS